MLAKCNVCRQAASGSESSSFALSFCKPRLVHGGSSSELANVRWRSQEGDRNSVRKMDCTRSRVAGTAQLNREAELRVGRSGYCRKHWRCFSGGLQSQG